ncbi:hypothetical protein [Ferrimonas senticii]|uniref:hypothetical protein n=1 Tax=Ferrimonas senticii TaxID=394566 RepID=UPI00040DABB6|nr:hypothetical protein [Ferrimonas senticii]
MSINLNSTIVGRCLLNALERVNDCLDGIDHCLRHNKAIAADTTKLLHELRQQINEVVTTPQLPYPARAALMKDGIHVGPRRFKMSAVGITWCNA